MGLELLVLPRVQLQKLLVLLLQEYISVMVILLMLRALDRALRRHLRGPRQSVVIGHSADFSFF